MNIDKIINLANEIKAKEKELESLKEKLQGEIATKDFEIKQTETSVGERWTEKDLTQMRKLLKEGKNHREIATIMGRTIPSVYKTKYHKLKQEKPFYWTKEEEEQLKQLITDGKTDREIREIIGRSKNAITAKRNVLGLKCNRISKKGRPCGSVSHKRKNKGWTDEEIQTVLEQTVKKTPAKKIAKIMGRTVDAIYNIIYKYNKKQLRISPPQAQPKEKESFKKLEITSESQEETKRKEKQAVKEATKKMHIDPKLLKLI